MLEVLPFVPFSSVISHPAVGENATLHIQELDVLGIGFGVPLRAAVGAVWGLTGMPSLFVALVVLSLFLTLPLAVIVGLLPHRLRLPLNVLIGLTTLALIFGGPFVRDFLLLVTLCYVAARWTSRWVSLWLSVVVPLFGLLAILHADRAFAQGASRLDDFMDSTGVMMALACRATDAAWTLEDNIKRGGVAGVSFLEFLGQCCFFPGLFPGPLQTSESFLQWTRGEESKDTGNGSRSSRTFFLVLRALCCLVLFEGHQLLGFKLEKLGAEDPGVVHLSLGKKYELFDTEDMGVWGTVAKHLFVLVCVQCFRYKYYGLWSMTEAACVACGYDNGGTRSGQNVDMWRIETSTGLRDMLAGWNISYNHWAKHNLAERFPKAMPGKLVIVRLFTALWHGLFPGYYMFFMGTVLLQLGMPSPHKSVNWGRLPRFLQSLFYQMAFNTIAMPFVLLEWGPSARAQQRLGWYVHVALLLSLGLKWVQPKPAKSGARAGEKES